MVRSAITFADPVNMPNWGVVGRDNIIASSNGEAIAAISNGADWDLYFSVTGLSRTAIDNAIANDDPSPVIDNITSSSSTDNTAIFSGSDIKDIDNPTFWKTTSTDPNYTNPNIDGTTFATQDANIFCFAAGTQIATPAGEVSVETLSIGTDILTADGRSVPVKWLGKQSLTPRHMYLERSLVRITAGSLGRNTPHTDLIVTGDHGVILEDMVINASALVNQTSIHWEPSSNEVEKTVYHVETDDHDVLLANGVEAETFLDAERRADFDNYQEYVDLYGAERIIPEMNRIRISSQRLLPDVIKAKIGNFDVHWPCAKTA